MPQTLTPDNLGDPILDHTHRKLVTFHENQTVQDSLTHLRSREISDRIVYLYVLNDKEQLVGVVPIRRLVTSDPESKLVSVMIAPVVTVPSSGTVLTACELFLKHRFLALPVVDDDGRLLGVVDVGLFTDEMVTAAQHHVTEVFQLIGIHVSLGRAVSPLVSFKDRFPWLLSNIASGIICAFIASRHELLISQVALLAMFLTVVLALGESVSMQSMTITLQGLSGKKSLRKIVGMLRKEFLTASMLGIACGLIVGGAAYFWRQTPLDLLAVGGSILLSMVTACVLGVVLPSAVHLLRMDPKVAAGPVVLASADVMTLVYYFNVSEYLLR